MAVFIGVLMVLASFTMCDGHGRYLSSVYGEVGRGNITHFSMAYHGTVLLELTSLSGDCDLYVSQFTIRPNYEPHSYCLQSMTCGIDTIVVPKSFKRPVGIGIFGYPTHTSCKYHLLFYEIDDVLDVFNHDYFSESMTSSDNEKLMEDDSGHSTVPDKEEEKGKGKEEESGGGGTGTSTGTSASTSASASVSASASASASVEGGEKELVKELKEKKRMKKLGNSDKNNKEDIKKQRRRYYEGESYFWIFLDYLIDCLIDLIL